SGRPHQVYIGPLLQEVLRSIPTTDSELVFPGRGGVVLSGWSKRLPRARRTIDLPVQLHGLRRGYRTALTELRTDRDVAELMVAHSREDLETRYDLSELSDLRREAQEKLEEAWMGVIL
ncbi:hypothetical protein, partial [uncultured Ruegeria sp.]|uniref:hypothetical protein n=1 Tax=uncultured Ruegeria sp. TaxID=259304 RepID=UPI00261EFFBC